MSSNSSIEWTDSTWNPIRGCSRVSRGCEHCYAEKAAYRFSGPGRPYEGLVRIDSKGKRHAEWSGNVRFVEKHLLDPLRWKPIKLPCADPDCGEMERATGCNGPESRPRRIFVNSMSDLFHENVLDEWIDKIFAVMALCPQHTFQVLTKRPERMLEYFSTGSMARVREAMIGFAAQSIHLARTKEPVLQWSGLPLPNVWLGISCEDQATADARIPLLLRTPAAVRFISAEPLLGMIDLTSVECWYDPNDTNLRYNALKGEDREGLFHKIGKLDWVIVGGESGPGARPMRPDWARSLRDQCAAAGVPFFFKQWGEWLPAMTDGATTQHGQELNCSDEPIRVGKHAAGALLDGREWREFRA